MTKSLEDAILAELRGLRADVEAFRSELKDWRHATPVTCNGGGDREFINAARIQALQRLSDEITRTDELAAIVEALQEPQCRT